MPTHSKVGFKLKKSKERDNNMCTPEISKPKKDFQMIISNTVSY